MGRSSPWRGRCPPVVEQRLAHVMSTPGYLLVNQPGPTSFVLKDDTRKYKVRIGDVQECSCNESKTELCTHILFIMARFLRVPVNNPLVWQRSLLEAEVDQVLGFGRSLAPPTLRVPRSAAGGSGAQDDRPQVERRPVNEGDSCPICCEDFEPSKEHTLVFCRYGCGNSVHASCFKEYAQHNASNPAPLQCPLCRNRWGTLEEPGRQQSHGVGCSACHTAICGELFRCAFCHTYHLCRACFEDPAIHPQHPFDKRALPGAPFVHVERPLLQQPVRSTAGVVASATATGAPPDPRLLDLMERDLRPEDYDLLSRLDEGVRPTTNQVLTEEQVGLLPRVRWSAAEHQYEQCAICMEDFRPGDPCIQLTTTCRHVFHAPCAFRWFTESRAVCPIDNTPVIVPHAPLTTVPSAPAGPSPSRSSAGPAAPPARGRRPIPAGSERRRGSHSGSAATGGSMATGNDGPGRTAGGSTAGGGRVPRRVGSTARPTLNRVGHVTEGSFRPSNDQIAGLSISATGLGVGGGPIPTAAANGGGGGGGSVALLGLRGPAVPARVSRLRAALRDNG